MTDFSLTPAEATFMDAPADVFDTPASVDGDMCLICGKGPFKRLNAHYTKSHNDGSAPAERVSVTRQVQKDISGKGAPSVDQLTNASARLLGYGSVAVASTLVDSDPRNFSEQQKDDIVEALSATPEEAKDIMRPIARIFAGTTLNKRVGRKIVDNMDGADSLIALYMMSRRWQQYLRERNEYAKSQQPVAQQQPQVVIQQPNVMQQRIQVQDAKDGVVVTPDMVAAMRAGR